MPAFKLLFRVSWDKSLEGALRDVASLRKELKAVVALLNFTYPCFSLIILMFSQFSFGFRVAYLACCLFLSSYGPLTSGAKRFFSFSAFYFRCLLAFLFLGPESPSLEII